MFFDIDVAIVIGFLVITIVAGLLSSRGIKSIREYAVGDRNFSTATIAATLIATWAGGQAFFTIVTQSYNHGLHFMWATILGDFLCYLFIGLFFAPRMVQFLGKLSIADAMGSLYGDKVRIVTAIAGCVGAAGMIAVQLKMTGVIFEYALKIPGSYGIVSAAVIVTLYSALGGVKSVTFTDIIQFFTFIVIIPTTAYILLGSIDNIDTITHTLKNNPNFDYKEVFNFSNPDALYHLFIFLFFIVPSFNPAIFQRVAMAQNVSQIRQSFVVAAITCLIFAVIVSWIGILTLSINPNLSSEEIVKHVIFDSSNIGFKGAILAGIMAMIFSTVDSYINSTAVILVHDFCKPLKMQFAKNELFSARIASLLIGMLALILSLRGGSLLELIIFTNSFYMPIVTVPFIVSILGFKTTAKSVLLGMMSGFITVLFWDYVLQVSSVNSVPIGMLANFVILICSHYILNQPGGFWGLNYHINSEDLKNINKIKKSSFLQVISGFNLIQTLKQNCPKGEGLISLIGFFVMISSFGSVHTLRTEYKQQYSYILDVLYPLSLFGAAILISYPLWLPDWKKNNSIAIIWNMIMFSTLICFSFLIVLISNFSDMQLMVFLANIIILSSLMKWKWSLFNIIFGIAFTKFCFEKYIFVNLFDDTLLFSEFKIVYLLLLLTGISIIFLKPKQEYLEATEEKAEHLEYEVKGLEREVGHARGELENVVQGLDFLENQFKDKEGKLKSKEIYLKDQLKLRNIEISKLKDLKDEFIRNIPHEANTPMTGILSLSEVLYSCYDSLDEKLVKQSIKDIVSSSDRLKSFVSNIADLSKLSALTYELNKTEVNLSELVRERPVLYKKIFADDDKQEFIFKVEDKLIVQCDEYYITQAIDNLISNAVKYGEGKPITISLTKTVDNNIQFRIADQGIGIPKDELISIFNKFTVSSKTQTPAGGRGVGLALCEKVISVHGGTIEAKSDGKKGSEFSFVLPL